MLESFLSSLQSKHSQRAYRRDVEEATKTLGDLSKVTIAHLLTYRASLLPQYAVGSVNRRIDAIRSYLNYLVTAGVIQSNPARSIKSLKNAFIPTEGLTNEEVGKLVSIANKTCSLDLDVCLLLLYTGIRVEELSNLNVDDLKPESLSIVGKGNKRRAVPLPKELSEKLAYRAQSIRGKSEAKNPPLFCARDTDRIHTRTVRIILKRLSKRADIKHVSPHMLRVTAVTNALNGGASLHEVKDLGGWSSIEMVDRYFRRNQKDSATRAASFINYKTES